MQSSIHTLSCGTILHGHSYNYQIKGVLGLSLIHIYGNIQITASRHQGRIELHTLVTSFHKVGSAQELGLSCLLYTSPFSPIVRSYSVSDYNAGIQNWSIAQDERGVMYFGNNNGLRCV